MRFGSKINSKTRECVSSGAPLLKSKYIHAISPGKTITFSGQHASIVEKTRSPGPIYDIKVPSSVRSVYKIEGSPGRKITGSIYESGFYSASPGPAYSTENEFFISSRYLSSTPTKFARETNLSSTGIETKIIENLNPLTARRRLSPISRSQQNSRTSSPKNSRTASPIDGTRPLEP